MNFARPAIWIVLLIAFVAVIILLRGILLPFVAAFILAYLLNPLVNKIDRVGVGRLLATLEFAMTVLFFLSSFATLALLFWPYMIPYSVTVGSAAAPDETLSFLFWGAGLFVLPVVAIYTIVVYWFFRGKMRTGYS